MPVLTRNVIEIPWVEDGSGGVLLPGNELPNAGKPITLAGWKQVIGFMPLTDCAYSECRTSPDCTYITPVLAENSASRTGDIYKNDRSAFLVDFPSWTQNNYLTSCAFYIDKWVNGAWVSQAALNSSTYGTFYNFNTWSQHKTYIGYLIYWNLVLNAFGEGTYRFRGTWGAVGRASQCFSSEPFCLLEWSCDRADRTVKVESTISYKIGSTTEQGKLFDLCSIIWYDSIRFKGKFGYRTFEAEEKTIKYDTGKILLTRSEQKPIYTLKVGRVAMWFHNRFAVYFHMSDTMLVSDYNYNNPEYVMYNRWAIAHNGSAYKPGYNEHSRLSRATAEYKQRQENIIKKICCDTLT